MKLPALAAWLVAHALAWIPASRGAPLLLREAIAKDAIELAFDPVEPPLYRATAKLPEPAARAKTALLLFAIARFESSFRADVDEGEVRGHAGDACIMQVVVPRGRRVVLIETGLYRWASEKSGEGLSAEDLVPGSIPGRRANCYRAAMHLARESFRACGSLSLYARGTCAPDLRAKEREELARDAWARRPAPASALEDGLAEHPTSGVD